MDLYQDLNCGALFEYCALCQQSATLQDNLELVGIHLPNTIVTYRHLDTAKSFGYIYWNIFDCRLIN